MKEISVQLTKVPAS